MNLDGLLKAAQKNASSVRTQKRFSLDVGPTKKGPELGVNPMAIQALLERKKKEKREEREKLITKAVESTRRDDVHYKDTKGLRKQEQEWSEKCKRQWLKVQRERREFIQHMRQSADERDKNKQVLDKDEVIAGWKKKETEQTKQKEIKEQGHRKSRKRKYELFEGSMEVKRKERLLEPPASSTRVTDLSQLLKIAQNNAASGAFGADLAVPCIPDPFKEEPRLLTASEKRQLAEEEAALRKARSISSSGSAKVKDGVDASGTSKPALASIGRIPKKSDCTLENNKSSLGVTSSGTSLKSKTVDSHHSSEKERNSSKQANKADSERLPSSKTSQPFKGGEHVKANQKKEGAYSKDSSAFKDLSSKKEPVYNNAERSHNKIPFHSKDRANSHREKIHNPEGFSKNTNKSTNSTVRHSDSGDRAREHHKSHHGKSSASSKDTRESDTISSVPAMSNGPSLASIPAGNNCQSKKTSQLRSSADRERLRMETARKLAQLQMERQAAEEEERKKRMEARKARQAEEERLKKKLLKLQTSGLADSEDESEEDDEEEDLDEYEDDFIDDGPTDDPYAQRYSQDIAKIFKYDKRKYVDFDDDDIEESSFSRCMAEEARSARLGRQEDLEDMRREEEELRKKSKGHKLEELAKKLKQKKKLTLCPI